MLWRLQWARQPRSCHNEIRLSTRELTRGRFVEFAMHRVRMLQHFGVIPFLIFDGDYLPSKAATEVDRAKRREEGRKAGQELLRAGKSPQAYLEFQKAVDVTPEMARQLIDELRRTGVQYLVAPYEADAQMVYLERKGVIDGIISEDSDLLVFGAKCLLTKLDQYGNCIEINKADFCACKDISLTGWSDVEFRRMAILSGCDYLNSITNMGLKTAYRMVRKYKTVEKIIRMLQFDGKFIVPKGYLEAFNQAELTFLHQRVFCPRKLTLVYHTEPEHPIDDQYMPFIGAYVEPQISQGVARGDLNPITKLPILADDKSKMADSKTPWANSRRISQRSKSTNSPKKGTPINTFFMPKRIPLAELEINCFNLSPDQQDTLSRNTGPWVASPAPRPYVNRGAADPDQLLHLPRSAPQITRNNATRIHTRTPNISEPRPPKRARLCADIETGASPSKGQTIELGRSRYFTSAPPDPSPSFGRNGHGRKSKRQDITIFSDDSVDEVMRSLPDIASSDMGPKFAVLQENPRKIPNSLQNISSVSASVDGAQTSGESAPGLTPTMSRAGSIDQQDPSTPCAYKCLPLAIESPNDALSPAPACTATSKLSHVGQALPIPSSSALTRPSRIPLAVKPSESVRPIQMSAKPAGLTPLQRLGASATSRSKLPKKQLLGSAFQNNNAKPCRSLLSKCSLPFPEFAQENLVTTIEPASIPLPHPDEMENVALSMRAQNGSEDLIIHESEEDDCLSPVADEITARINLGRFSYAS